MNDMDAVSLLSSLNKIGLIAFLITLGVLIYEVVLLTRTKKTNAAPQVPQFQEGDLQLLSQAQTTEAAKIPNLKNVSKNNKIILIGLTVLLIFFGGFTLISSLNRGSSSNNSEVDPTPAFSVDTDSKVVVPTGIVMVNKYSTPTSASSVSANFENPTPTATLLAEATITPTPSEDIKLTPLTEELPSPTIISELPVTSYINNLLILFSVSAIFLFFAFLF